MKQSVRIIGIWILCWTLFFSNGVAQTKATVSAIGVGIQQSYVGVAIGLWHGIGLSVNGERILKDLPEFNGLIGAGGEIGYAADKDEWKYWGEHYGWKYTYIPIFGFASFHYRLTNPKIDPYVRLGLGYVYVNSKAFGTYTGYWGEASSSYVGINGQVGVRYFVSPNLCARAALGTPWLLSVGADFKF
ncbi:MAG: hypothetical protein ONB05_06835 [candidate division KSB1 bacterium]|nr:hypothetical protein [candidate division KSB1 bacterium]